VNGQHPLSRRKFILASAGTLAFASAAYQLPAAQQESPQALRARLAADPQRPRYHFLAPAHWMNDPNGPIYRKGDYHMFYQYNPNGAYWGDMHWGHATSRDLIHWKHLPVALAPTPGGPDKDGCFSGSAVDHHGVPTLFYTGVSPEVQCVATSQDMITWKKYAGNPVIAGPPAELTVTGFRDPALWQEGDTWLLVIGSGFKGAGGCALLYESKNLTDWSYLHPPSTGPLDPRVHSDDPVATAEMWECPDFFRLGGERVLLISTQYKVRYYIGKYESRKFQPNLEGIADYGAYYAAKSMVDAKGRRILWGWIQERRTVEAQKAAGWSGAISLPRALSLRSDGALGIEPVAEIEMLRGQAHEFGAQDITPESPPLKGAGGDTLEIVAEFEPGSAEACGLCVRESPYGAERTLITYRRDSNTLAFDSSRSSLNPDATRGVAEGPLHLAANENFQSRLFLDGSVMEVYANGRACLTGRAYPTRAESLGLRLFARGGKARLVSMKVWEMRPISPDRLTT
jgi:beta-fructofuranosidase